MNIGIKLLSRYRKKRWHGCWKHTNRRLSKWQVIVIVKIKCKNCGQTLLFANHADIEMKCPRCKKINRIKMEHVKTEPRATPVE
ncbi:Com family DNA-binding transcriptional regulator [Anaerotruncus sp. 80]|uniref:Com family DNA-binding transcriptional regulator n=1 Tax=Anaerotruncus colihominis TaxID=169435 RepID=A0A845QNE6_9FIRM|nr:Com family DNA-binding transcriptional regulator [Anaerotruncus colihominis]NCF02223.1 Com family DNA-binding transcriptional regulator [Anaerotruncus sp. 80]